MRTPRRCAVRRRLTRLDRWVVDQRGGARQLGEILKVRQNDGLVVDLHAVFRKCCEGARENFRSHAEACRKNLLVKGQIKRSMRSCLGIPTQQPVGKSFETGT